MSKDIDYIENCLEKMSKGNFFFYVNSDILKKKNSAGRMARYIRQIVDNECKKLEYLQGLSEGNFDVQVQKADPVDKIGDAIEGLRAQFSRMKLQLDGINEQLAGGNTDIRFDDEDYRGGFKEISSSINRIMDSVLLPLNEAQRALKAMSANDFSVHLDDSKGALKELAKAINNLSLRLKSIEDALNRLACGDFSAAEQLKKDGKLGENDNITPALIALSDSAKFLAAETRYIADNCAQGRIFETRGDAEKFEGGAKAVVEDINRILDSVASAVKESAEAVFALSQNPEEEIEKSLPGDFGRLCEPIESVRRRLNEVKALSQKISAGRFSEIAQSYVPSKKQDELTAPLVDAAKKMSGLVSKTSAMKKALESGDFSYRIDTSGADGEYGEILENYNEVFETATVTVRKISDALESLAAGNTSTVIDETYTGVFEKLRTNVNAIIKRDRYLVDTITSCLATIANGNLNIDRIDEFAGDWNSVSAALNNIVNSLNRSVGSIYNAVDEVAAGANQLAASSQNISKGATEQAGSIEELTTSIARVASQTQLNASNAGKANLLAKEMSERAAAGSKEMNEMLQSMQEINESTKNISKIIKVIDDIAFQTNILALNAAVEAAHAGQNGKGFAVVAEEVRNLAARSANAVKDTAALIQGSINSVEKGTSIAKDTAKTFGNFIEGVDKVAELVENIANASNEQANNIIEINKALERISRVVQSDSATAEQGATASIRLSKQAEILKSSVEKFRLNSKAAKPDVAKKESNGERARYAQKTAYSAYKDFGKY